MKVFRTAAIIAVMMAGPAYAQTNKPPAVPPEPPKSQSEIDSDKAADKAYKKSLGNIPDKPPADPWGIARDADTPKAATKVQTNKKTKTGSTTTN
jgi:hypothetical protein